MFCFHWPCLKWCFFGWRWAWVGKNGLGKCWERVSRRQTLGCCGHDRGANALSWVFLFWNLSLVQEKEKTPGLVFGTAQHRKWQLLLANFPHCSFFFIVCLLDLSSLAALGEKFIALKITWFMNDLGCSWLTKLFAFNSLKTLNLNTYNKE